MNHKTKTYGALGLIIGGLLLAIAMFVIFLKQQAQINEQKIALEQLSVNLEAKKLEFEELYTDCLEKTRTLEGIDQAEIEAAQRKADNGRYHLGISAPTLTKAEGLELLTRLKSEGYNIWYANEKTGDLGNMYYYENGQTVANDVKNIIYEMFPNRNRFNLDVKSGGSGSGIPASIRDNTILIKL